MIQNILILQTKMKVVVGIDIGSWTFKINAYSNNQFTLLTNEANFRETPSLVAFHESHRLVGEQAINKIKSNYKNTVRAPMRLIGLEKNFDLIEEELKYATMSYDASEQLYFSLEMGKNQKARLQPEHFMISLLSKIYGIIVSHNLFPEGYYLVVPSYLSHYQRKIIKKCGQIVLHASTVALVDDWVSLAAQYAYTHAAQIKNSNRTIIFVDIGYSKCSFFVVEFTPREPRLLDCEHMRFMGSKNMDHLLAEHYDQMMKNGRGTQDSVFSAQKAKVKLLDQVQKQRKVLSANQECHISVEALFQDYDFSHNLKRDEFEKIVGPVLQQIRKGLIKIKSRMPTNYRAHSLQLVGGASRIPYIKTIIKQIFSTQPSRTLNLSESIARGAAIYGALNSKLLPLQYSLPNYNLIDICISWNQTRTNQFYGENENQYKNRFVVFPANSYAPCENILPIGNEGPIQLYIYYGQAASTKSIGYLRFNSPNRVRFILDSSKIVDVYLQMGSFIVKKMQDKKQNKWKDLAQWEEDIRIIEERINAILHLKNQYESKFYQLRTGIADYKDYMSPSEVESFTQQFKAIQDWIQTENNRTMSSAQDLELYESQLDKIKTYERALNVLKDRKQAGKSLIDKYEKLKKYMEDIPLQEQSVWQRRKLGLLAEWLTDSYTKMAASNWEGYYLTDQSLKFAEEEVKRILRGEVI